MDISLTHLRQNLFALADEVIRTGEPLCIERRGVRLQLVRAQPEEPRQGRLSRLRSQDLTIGAALDPHESPALWDVPQAARGLQLAEPPPAASAAPKARRSR